MTGEGGGRFQRILAGLGHEAFAIKMAGSAVDLFRIRHLEKKKPDPILLLLDRYLFKFRLIYYTIILQ